MASTKIQRFAIYSAGQGKREDYPSILLDKALMPDNSNIQIINGEVVKAKLRSKELTRNIYSILSVDIDADTITIDGDYTAIFTDGFAIATYDSDNDYDEFVISGDSTLVSGDTVITVTGDITASTPADYIFRTDNVASADPASDDFLKVGTPDGNDILKYKRFMLTNGTERLVAFTKAHIYFWDTTIGQWNLIFTCSSDCTYWDVSQGHAHLAATNNVDRPIYWDGDSSTTFEDLDTQYSSSSSEYIATAKFVTFFENYLILGNVSLSNGELLQHSIYWSNIIEGFEVGGFRQDQDKDAGTAYIDGDGEISGGFGMWHGYLVVFKRWSIRKLWAVVGNIPFQQDELFAATGCYAPGSVVNDRDGNLYFYGSDKTFREINTGIISHAVIDTAKNINPNKLDLIRSTFIDEYSELCWAIPSGASAEANNKIIVMHDNKWTVTDIPVTAFGQYSRQTNWTWDTLPYSTWGSWAWDSWDSAEAASDYLINLCSYGGYTYNAHGSYVDDGSAYESYFVLTTDMADKQALSYYKRLLWMHFYIRKQSSGTMSIYIKRDNETDWQSVGSIAMTGDEDILVKRLDCDYRAKHFLIKITSEDAFDYIGTEFEFMYAGDR